MTAIYVDARKSVTVHGHKTDLLTLAQQGLVNQSGLSSVEARRAIGEVVESIKVDVKKGEIQPSEQETELKGALEEHRRFQDEQKDEELKALREQNEKLGKQLEGFGLSTGLAGVGSAAGKDGPLPGTVTSQTAADRLEQTTSLGVASAPMGALRDASDDESTRPEGVPVNAVYDPQSRTWSLGDRYWSAAGKERKSEPSEDAQVKMDAETAARVKTEERVQKEQAEAAEAAAKEKARKEANAKASAGAKRS